MSRDSGRSSRLAPAVIAIAAVLLGLAGLTEYTDGIVRYVTHVVDAIAWTDVWRPAFDPPPMNTYTYRPLTVVMVKLELLLAGRDPYWMTVLHLLTIPWLGFAAHRFLRTHGMARVATLGALSTMALPSMLFSGWIPVESDGVGAAFLCEAGWALQRWRLGARRKHLVLFVLAALGAATTKETSAAACMGYLLAFTWAYRHDGLRRWLAVSGAYAATLFVLVLPLLLATSQAPHDFHVRSEGFLASRAGWLMVHNLAQLFYVTSSAGIVLILMARRAPLWLVVASLALLLAAPPLRVYNHYEAVIIDQVGYVVICTALLVGSLVWTVARRAAPPEHTAMAGAVLFLLGVLSLAPVLMLQSRPDVSARLYAPIIPMLHGLAWTGAAVALDAARLSARPRLARGLTWVVVVCFAAFPLSGASNGIQLFRARMSVESTAKAALAERLKQPGLSCPFVIAINRDHELASEELEAFGVDWTRCSTLFVPNRVHLDPADADLSNWRVQGHRYSLLPADQQPMTDALLEGRPPARCTYLYLQTPKATMDTGDYRRFSGDFLWAFGRLPEFDEEVYEQQVEIQFRERTGYQKLFERGGAGQIGVESTFDLLPLNLNEAPRRLLSGLPVIESYAYEGRLFYFESCLTNENH